MSCVRGAANKNKPLNFNYLKIVFEKLEQPTSNLYVYISRDEKIWKEVNEILIRVGKKTETTTNQSWQKECEKLIFKNSKLENFVSFSHNLHRARNGSFSLHFAQFLLFQAIFHFWLRHAARCIAFRSRRSPVFPVCMEK